MELRIALRAEDGTSDPPRLVLLGESARIRAVVPLGASGTFRWSTRSKKLTLGDPRGPVVTVTAGTAPSEPPATEEITLAFAPPGQPPVAASLELVVANLEIVSNVPTVAVKGTRADDRPARATRSPFLAAPAFVGVGVPVELRPFLEGGPASKGFTWSTRSPALALATPRREVLRLQARAPSAARDDLELDLEVATDRGPIRRSLRLTALALRVAMANAPRGFPILEGADREDPRKLPRFELGPIVPDLAFAPDDERLGWWLRGGDAPSLLAGKGDFPPGDRARRGTRVHAFGTRAGKVRVGPASGGFHLAWLDVRAVPLEKTPFEPRIGLEGFLVGTDVLGVLEPGFRASRLRFRLGLDAATPSFRADEGEVVVEKDGAVLHREALAGEHLTPGERGWAWDGHDDADVLDTARLLGSGLTVTFRATQAFATRSASLRLSGERAGAHWVDARVDATARRVRLDLRVGFANPDGLPEGELRRVADRCLEALGRAWSRGAAPALQVLGHAVEARVSEDPANGCVLALRRGAGALDAVAGSPLAVASPEGASAEDVRRVLALARVVFEPA